MDKLKRISAAFLLCSFSIATWAQKDFAANEKNTTTATNESIYMNVNSTSFVTGETIFYKIYCINPIQFTQSYVSKIAYVEFVGSEEKIIFNHKIFLENGTGQGDFFIPPSVPTGNYKLIAYTKWMLNKTNAKSFEVDVTIINPFQNDNENKISSKNKIVATTASSNADQKDLKLDLNKKTFSTRELVNLKINTINPNLKNGKYSVSIRKIQDLPTIKKTTIEEFTKSEVNQKLNTNSNDLILPELRGEIVSGKIASNDELYSVSNVSVAISIPGKSFTFKLVKTNKEGKFIFTLDKVYYDAKAVIQIVNRNKENYTITLDKPATLNLSEINIENDAPVTASLKAVIEEHSIASQIENTYYLKKADTLSSIYYPTQFYEPYAKEYILDNYTRFPTIKETTTEVIKEMNYDKTDGKYALRLNDYDPNTEVDEPPLVLLDGLLIQDIDELFQYKAANIYKVCIINSGYSYGNNLFNGLISFISKKQDFVSAIKGSYIVNTSLATPTLKKNYFKPEYSDKTTNNRIPDYRYQLLWIPELKIANNENAVSFYTSDKTGQFEIVLEGFTNDGTPVSLKDYFEVN